MPVQSDRIISEEATFTAEGGVRLLRRSVFPGAGGASPAWARLAILHGYGDHSGRFLHVMRWMAERGVACHALDFRGHGRSGGRRGFVTRWDDYLDDLDAFLGLDAVQGDGSSSPLFVLGHSHGGLVLAAAGIRGLAGVEGCIFSAPYLRSRIVVPPAKVRLARLVNPVTPWLLIPSGLRDEWMSSDPVMVADSRADPLILHGATPRWYLGCREAQAEVARRAGEFSLPHLLLMGGADPVSDGDAAREFSEGAASSDKTFRLYPRFLHELLRETGREEILNHILEWLRERTSHPATA
ncbi:MAG TPA: lysophospholipase [Armatimonadota bacterium]|nr:lysophospholipase [Armatimonadota bacterium]